MSAFSYWESGEGLGNITPPGNLWPEGVEFQSYYPAIFGDAAVVEFGCGVGRLAQLFKEDRYRGVDICEPALRIARSARPGYRFDHIDVASSIVGGDIVFSHNVLMHVPDADLDHTIGRFGQGKVVISEVLGKIWRRAGNPPVFNREIQDYVVAFMRHGYTLKKHQIRRAENYVYKLIEMDFGILEFEK